MIARGCSLLLAILVSSALMLLPAMRGGELSAAGHGLLSPLMLTVCALFVHGLGYRPRHRASARLLSPWLLWPLVIALSWWWWRAS